MKRFAFLSLLLLIPLNAQAGQWVTKEIKWNISNVGAPFNATGIYVRDTTHQVLSGDTRDTTGWFSLDDADIPPRGATGPGALGSLNVTNGSGSDTTTIAYLVFQSDSTAAPTATLSSLTILIDGRVGGFGNTATLARGWVKADSALVNGAAAGTLIVGDESVGVPIRSISPYGNIRRFGQLRARQTAATGILTSVRAFVRYWDND